MRDMESTTNLFVAPMTDICQTWQQENQLKVDWFFNKVKSLEVKNVVFHSVASDSELFNEIVSKCSEESLRPDFVLGKSDFLKIENSRELLEQGVGFVILFSSPITPLFIEKIKEFEEFLPQLQFVIIGRKDWNVRNTYRSIPHFMRSRLFVDFPVSLYEGDAYFDTGELKQVVPSFENDFLDGSVRSYCPSLSFYTGGSHNNISHFSIPRKLTKNTPVVSVITSDPELMNKLAVSKMVLENPEKLELIVTRVAGQKTQVIPRIKSVLTTRYWAHPKNPDRPVSSVLLDNFSAGQASGEYLFYLDERSVEQIDQILLLLFEGQLNEKKQLEKSRAKIFKTEEFKKMGGLDQAFTSQRAAWVDGSIRYLQLEDSSKGGDLLDSFFSEPAENSTALLNKKMLSHKFVGHRKFDIDETLSKAFELSEQSFTEQEELIRRKYKNQAAKERYMSLYKNSPKVVLEGHLSYLLKPFLFLWRNQAWRLKPSSYSSFWKIQGMWKRHAWKLKKPFTILSSHFWRLDFRSYAIYWTVLRFFRQIWKGLSWVVATPFNLAKENIWRLDPRVYKSYWGAKALMRSVVTFVSLTAIKPARYLVSNFWRLDPKTYSFYWSVRARVVSMKTSFSHFFSVWLKGNLWRLDPKAYGFYWGVKSRINGFFGFIKKKTTELFWVGWHYYCLLRGNLWRLSAKQVGWYIFRLMFPLRKIYYFIHFQYEKRVLGLHKKGTSS